MASRRVTHVRRNDDGDIVALCHPGEPWSPREKEDAIDEIEHSRNRYYVRFGDVETNVRVVHDPDGTYLRTVADRTSKDNLERLPDCHQ